MKIVETKENKVLYSSTKVPMNFMLNDLEVDTPPIGLSEEIVHDKTNINVTTKELRLKWKEGMLSLI